MADSSPPTRCIPGFPSNIGPSSHEVTLRSDRLPSGDRGEVGLKHFHTPRKVGQFGTHRRQLLTRGGNGRFVALGDTRQVIVGEAQSTRDVSQRRAGALLFSPALDLSQRGHGHTRSFGKFALCDATFGHPIVHDLRDISPVSQVGNLRTSSDRLSAARRDRWEDPVKRIALWVLLVWLAWWAITNPGAAVHLVHAIGGLFSRAAAALSQIASAI